MDNTTARLLELIRSGAAVSRAQLVQATGLARGTVAARVESLLLSGLVRPDHRRVRDTGGRPAERLRIDPGRGYLLGADIGGSHTRVGLLDLEGGLLASSDHVLDVNAGPEAVLAEVCAACDELLAERDVDSGEVFGIAAGVPGPVDPVRGQVRDAPTMHGWSGFGVAEWLTRRFGAPAAADKDANILAIGEQGAFAGEADDLIVLKVGMGIGAGIIAGGQIFRGSQGAAGDLGHLPRRGGPPCRCGQSGCAEATAGGWAIVQRLEENGVDGVRTSQDIVRLAVAKDPLVLDLLRRAGNCLGEVLAEAVGILNPSLVVVAGNLASSSDVLLAGIRERLYEESHPLATRDLRVEPGRLGRDAGLAGAGRLAMDVAFSGARVGELVDD